MAEGFNFLGVEQEKGYLEIAQARIGWAKQKASRAGEQEELWEDVR